MSDPVRAYKMSNVSHLDDSEVPAYPPPNHQFFHSVFDESAHAVSGINTVRSGVLSAQDVAALRLLASDEEFNEASDLSQMEHSVDEDHHEPDEYSALRSVASRQTYSTFNGSRTRSRRNTVMPVDTFLLHQEIGLLRDNGFDHQLARTMSKQSGFSRPGHLYTPSLGPVDVESIAELWDEAVDSGDITALKALTELGVLVRSLGPLIITFLLQSLLSFNALFFIGRLNRFELISAYTLGSMTGNITGLVVVQGLSTCLDTLCSQAYGAGKYHLVGTYFQRCTFLILLVFIPISGIWWFWAELIIKMLVASEGESPANAEMAHYATLYLKYLIPGVPGYIFFETGKRFLQLQGIYIASTYTLVFVVFVNFLLNSWLISPETLGFTGAPVSLLITFWIMPLGLLLYVLVVSHFSNKKFSQLEHSESLINADDPLKCWPGLRFEALFHNWALIFQLAIPGTIMCLAEMLAFEILTFSSSHISAEALAAQSIIASIGGISFQIPFGLSIATSTRVANLIGAGLPANLCYKTVNVALVLGICLALAINFNVLYFGRHMIPRLFTDDESLIELTAENLPLIAYISIFDQITAISSGVLRGMGLQKIGSWLNLGIYYIYGVPCSFFLTFACGWGIAGLWAGVGSGLSAIGLIQCAIIWWGVDYTKLVHEARERMD